MNDKDLGAFNLLKSLFQIFPYLARNGLEVTIPWKYVLVTLYDILIFSNNTWETNESSPKSNFPSKKLFVTVFPFP